MGRFKGGFRCKGWVNSVTINVITDITTYRDLKKILVQCKNMYVHNKLSQ